MVGKLLKHDLIALFRILLYMSCVALGLAVIARIMIAASDITEGENFFALFMSIMSLWASLALIFAAFIASLSRFYKSLFTGEGYMTFSLPVSVTKLLIAKLLSAFIASLVGFVVFVANIFILLSGLSAETFQEVMNFIASMFDQIGSIFSYEPLLAIEIVILIIVLIPMSLLQYYFCFSLAQMSSKHRVGVAFGILIALTVVLSILNAYCLTPILNVAAEVSPHLSVWLNIIVVAGLDVGYFFAVRYLLSHKLNLLV